jgi:selenide, water dikinase
MQQTLPERTIILLGVGHTHAHIVRMWAMAPLPESRLVCLSDFPTATYSGMLPGVLAGNYRREQMEIDLVRLCSAAGALLITDPVTGLDLDRREVLFQERPPLEFDLLSIGIGSVPKVNAKLASDARVVPIKPMQTFLERLETPLLGKLNEKREQAGTPLRVVIVGGGVGGVEVAFCLPRFIASLARRPEQAEQPQPDCRVTLIHGGEELMPDASSALRRRVERSLRERGIEIRSGHRVSAVSRDEVQLDDGTTLPADLVLWSTGAAPPPLLGRLGLPLDERGFLLTEPTLKTTAPVPVFVVGDTGTIRDQPVSKAGVYAVRQGPVLWNNIRNAFQGRPLDAYRPQRRFLKLLNRGDGTALGEYGSYAFEGTWAWRLKDWIDVRFVEKYQLLKPMPMNDEAEPMRCHGCGSKISSTSLFRTLGELDAPVAAGVPIGLREADDAAVIETRGGDRLALTTDFFSAPFEDPYLSGRVAALHAMSDAFAMGARPTSAMALITLPPGRSSRQEELLRQLIEGSLAEFRRSGTALVGGHTTEGLETVIGFSIVAEPWGERLCRKGQGRRAEAQGPSALSPQPSTLILTKPLGTGVLLAAHRQGRCSAEWYQALVESMLASVEPAARTAWELGAEWMTDVTGFGLAGHLLELLRGQPVSARLDLARLPLLPGSVELAASGIASSLWPANREAFWDQIEFVSGDEHHPAFPLLFDPQTCGGLLVVLEEKIATEFLSRTPDATVIGQITNTGSPGTIEI